MTGKDIGMRQFQLLVDNGLQLLHADMQTESYKRNKV